MQTKRQPSAVVKNGLKYEYKKKLIFKMCNYLFRRNYDIDLNTNVDVSMLHRLV